MIGKLINLAKRTRDRRAPLGWGHPDDWQDGDEELLSLRSRIVYGVIAVIVFFCIGYVV